MGTSFHFASLITLGLTLPAVWAEVAVATPSVSSSESVVASQVMTSHSKDFKTTDYKTTTGVRFVKAVQDTPEKYSVAQQSDNEEFTPPDNGGPDSSQGSGTR